MSDSLGGTEGERGGGGGGGGGGGRMEGACVTSVATCHRYLTPEAIMLWMAIQPLECLSHYTLSPTHGHTLPILPYPLVGHTVTRDLLWVKLPQDMRTLAIYVHD